LEEAGCREAVGGGVEEDRDEVEEVGWVVVRGWVEV
jgi:hypothetical protein